MSSNARMTHSKGESDGLSIPYKMNRGKGKGKKSTTQSDMAQQPTSATHRLHQLQQQPIVKLTLLPQSQCRPISSQSTAGPLTGERPPSWTLPVADAVEGCPKSTPPFLAP